MASDNANSARSAPQVDTPSFSGESPFSLDSGTPCNCRICNRHQRLKAVIERRDTDELIHAVKRLDDAVLHAEADAEYYEAILDGAWPSSVEILTAALEKAKRLKGGGG